MLLRGLRIGFSEYRDPKRYNAYNSYQRKGGNQGGYQGSQSNYQGGQGGHQGEYQNNREYSQNIIESSIDVKNYNLQISLEKFSLSMYLFPPTIIKKSANVFEIKKGSPVMGIQFLPKSEQGDETNWAARKSFNFKMLDIGKILYVEPGKGKTSTISSMIYSKNYNANQPQMTREFSLRDDIQKETINMTIRDVSSGSAKQDNSLTEPLVDCMMSYEEYMFFYELIRCSLFEISGWKLQMDIHKKDIFNKIFDNSKGVLDPDLENMFAKKSP